MKTEVPMDFPYPPNDALARRAHGPIATWLLIALIGVVLGGACLATAFTTDTRDFAARHGTVLKYQAL
jgi:hypothetical protein